VILTPQLPQALAKPTARLVKASLDCAYFDSELRRGLGLAQTGQVEQSYGRALARWQRGHRSAHPSAQLGLLDRYRRRCGQVDRFGKQPSAEQRVERPRLPRLVTQPPVAYAQGDSCQPRTETVCPCQAAQIEPRQEHGFLNTVLRLALIAQKLAAQSERDWPVPSYEHSKGSLISATGKPDQPGSRAVGA